MKQTVNDARTRLDDPLYLTAQVANACAEAKGKDITVLDMSKMLTLSDYFVVTSGRSDRQVQGIANRIIDALAAHGVHPLSCEGLDEGQWVLVDYGDVIVHVFYEPMREHYDIEGLWTRARRLVVTEDESGNGVLLQAA
jgi:ribosome-associated protein